ncbi:MAG: 50S ribosomal protein L25 [Elusimicrobiaceae bacterium]|nr:50S ribosomal protein L25 [Elusimicrobiaceae bacterium]
MQKVKIKAQPREKAGVRGELSKIRAQKNIPAVLYGEGLEPVSITVSQKDLAEIQKAGSNAIVELALPKGNENAIIKEVQYHVVTDNPIHIDFQRISMDKPLETVVPIVLKGDCAWVKENGGIVDHTVREVAIKCLPADIPHEIDVDITGLTLDKHVTLADLVAPKGVTILGEPDRMIVHIMIPREEVAAAPAAAAGTEAAQPELSATKGKKEEEGAAAAGDKKPAEKK